VTANSADVNKKIANPPSASAHDNPELCAAIDHFLRECEQGPAPRIDMFSEQYPDIAEELRHCLAGLELVRHAAPGIGDPDALHQGFVFEANGPSQSLGDYRLLREVGRGGMGVVYEAEQLSLARRVALKILPFAAVLDPRHLQRFKNEALAAAHLDHPHIVEVYGIGCERGIHFYAMRFIDGVTLAEVIAENRSQKPEVRSQKEDERGAVPEDSSLITLHSSLPADTVPVVRAALSTVNSLSPKERFRRVAELGVQAAEALEHAHQTGIVHRDIKPSNLMLDERGKLWITDFGLARNIADASMTMTGDLIGTLRYMSPEQAESRNAILDHRTDIYSLGATLYELATDRPVVEGQERAQILREIAETDPTPPRKHTPAMPADLETILLKCLAKEPSARYSTAKALAEDLRRFLEQKPVVARRPRLFDTLVKSARRHKVVVTATAIVFATLVAGIVGTTWQAIRAQHAEEQAKERYQQARRAVDEMYTGVAEDWLSQEAALSGVQRDFLQKALDFHEQFAADAEIPQAPIEVARSRFRVGRIQRALGDFEQAENTLTKAVAEYRDLYTTGDGESANAHEFLQLTNELCFLFYELGRADESEQQFRQAVATIEASVAQDPTDQDSRLTLATALRLLGATTYEKQPEQAEIQLVRSRYLCHQLLAEGYHYEQCVLDTARADQALAALYLGRDRLPDAENAIRSAVESLEVLVELEPDSQDYQRLLAQAVETQAGLFDQLDQGEDAIAAGRRAVAISQRLVKQSPTRGHRGLLLRSYFNLLQSLEDRKEIESIARRGILLGQALVGEFPDVPDYKADLAQFLLACATCVRDSQPELSRQQWERSYSLGEQLYAGFPDDPYYTKALAITSAFTAMNYAAHPLADPFADSATTVAVDDPELALKRAEQAVALEPENAEFRWILACAQYRNDDFEGCVATFAGIDAKDLQDSFAEFYLAMAHWRLGNKELAKQTFERADQSLAAALDQLSYFGPATVQRIRDEAAALLGVGASDTDALAEPTDENTNFPDTTDSANAP
jgi:serine/threonine protein kinase/tetratricopeptide (TPR) repeat protein